MLKTLYARLVAVLLGLLVFIGAMGLVFVLSTERRYQQEANQRLNRTLAANLVGCPAMSICCGFSSGKLPIGLQIMTPAFTEAKLLRIARMFEGYYDGAGDSSWRSGGFLAAEG